MTNDVSASTYPTRGPRRYKSPKPVAQINVTPFVDVMLVLLVIFMVTSPMLITGVSVDLPETSNAAVTPENEPLSVSIDAKGQVFLQTTKIAPEALIDKLTAITKEKKDTRIFVSGDKSVNYGHIMEVIGAIHGAGFTKVALLTDNETTQEE